jgi:hypothetical protein
LVSVSAHAQFEGAGAQQRGGAKGLVEQRAAFFRRHVLVLAAARRQGIATGAALTREGFEIAQWAGQSSAAAAVAQMAARQAKGTGPLAQAVRERQDLERQWRVADARLNDAVAKGDVTLASELRRELGGLDGKFAGIDARLVREKCRMTPANSSPLPEDVQVFEPTNMLPELRLLISKTPLMPTQHDAASAVDCTRFTIGLI